MTSPALVLLLLAASARAEQSAPAPAAQEYVDPEALRARAEALRDAVADVSVSNFAIKERAHGFFDKLPMERLAVPVGNYRRMEQERVDGRLGSIEGMQKAADARIEEWKRTHHEPPPPELLQSADEARALQAGKRLDYDAEGRLAPNQMGTFKYMKDQLTGGLVTLNQRMRLLSAIVGEAFTYATVAHEARHSLDRAAGRLSPEREIEGEISAFRSQYLWLKLMDPSGERMLTLHGTLKLRRDRAVDPDIKAAYAEAVVYIEHLSDVRSTGGDEDKLKKLVEKLGYSDGHDHHDHDGHEHGRAAALPPSA
jgi:hypothetical protein